MSIFVPYLIISPSGSFVQNSTVIDVQGSYTLEILAPPRVDSLVFLIGEIGRTDWPLRRVNESWETWLERGGASGSDSFGVSRNIGNSTLDSVENSNSTGGAVSVKVIPAQRPTTVGASEGGSHSSGIVHGRKVYERVYEITDPTDTFDIVDGKAGYWDRWAGQGNPAYEDAAQ